MKRFGLLAVGVVSMLAACAAPSGPSSPADPTTISLDGTSWVVTAIKGTATIAAHQPTIGFDARRFAGSTGCNSYGGEFTQTGRSLTLGPAVQTEMACLDGAVMQQESRFVAALAEARAVTEADGGAAVLSASGEVVLTLRPAPPKPSPKPLTGVTWKLETIRKGEAASSVVSGSTVTLTITGGTYSGRACNNFGGDLTHDATTIGFSAPHSTRMACPSSDLSAQEATVLGMLTSLTSWTIDGDRLSLSAPDGSGLDFLAS